MTLDPSVTSQSRSDAQQAAEHEVRAVLSDELGIELLPRRVNLEDGAYVNVNGVGPNESVLVEIFVHVGPLKGGQRHKIQGDVLKLATLAKTHPASRLILAFADHEAADAVRGWLAYATSVWGIERRVAALPEKVRAGLIAAQERQRMVNPNLPDDVGPA